MRTIRDAVPADAEACAVIYAHYVRTTATSFELEPPTPEQLAERMVAAQRKHAWLVCEDDGSLIGYAYGTDYKPRAAYRWSCETSVYLDPARTGTGAGRALYEALLIRLTERGFRLAIAGITLPNDASVGLHDAFGFRVVGTYSAVGWKHGAWHDVRMLQRPLGDGPGTAPR